MKYVFLLWLFILPQLVNAKPLKICGSSFPPSTIVENSKLVSGYSVELIIESFKRLGLEYHLEVLPWKRCLWLVKTNDFDAVIDTSIYNKPIVTGKLPISFNQLAIYVRDDFELELYSAQKLKGKLIGIPRGYTSYAKIAQERDWEVEETDNEENMFTMLKNKRFDYALSDTSTALSMAASVGANVRPLNPMVTSEQYYLGFSPNNAKLADAFDNTLIEMIHDGSLDKIYSQYLPYTYTQMKKASQFSPD